MAFVLQHLFIVLGFALAVLLIARLLREQRPPGNTIAWLLSILLIPYVGVPLYLLLGGRKIKKYQATKESLPAANTEGVLSEVEKILGGTGAPAATSGNRAIPLASAHEAYRELLLLIDQAKDTIHIATFIFATDSVGIAIRDELCKKARQGVKVRLLLDAFGCFMSSGRFLKPLIEAGGEVGKFLPVFPTQRHWSANLRNHRKLWIIDHSKAIIGGRNIGGEYLCGANDEAQWRDFNLEIEGPAVYQLEQVFASDWNFATGETLSVDQRTPAFDEDGRMQIVPAGPDMVQDSLREGVIAAILSAKNRIWIVTPYFIPDEMIIQSLSMAARLGKDVRIIIPRKSNHRIADFARASSLRQLQKLGVRFYAFEASMVHTKLIVIDDKIGVVGSANMDMRSLYLNYEIAAFVYSPDTINLLASHVLELLSESSLMEREDETKKVRGRIWLEDISRLLAPML